jgi:hypothetical protein
MVGVFGFFCFFFFVFFFWCDIRRTGMQGAAASTFSMAAFFATVYPTQSILLYGILPVPAAVLVGGLFGLNVYQSLQRGAPVMPELVGPLAGFALALALRGRVRF